MDIVTKEMLYQPGPGEYDSPKRFGEGAPSVGSRLSSFRFQSEEDPRIMLDSTVQARVTTMLITPSSRIASSPTR